MSSFTLVETRSTSPTLPVFPFEPPFDPPFGPLVGLPSPPLLPLGLFSSAMIQTTFLFVIPDRAKAR
jgi:hypothetical protein